MQNNDHRTNNAAYRHKILMDYSLPGGGILSDEQIEELGIVSPCVRSSPAGKISYGLTSYGYDMRVGSKFKVFTDVYGVAVDPKHLDSRCFIDMETELCLIPPNSFALAESVETFNIPRGILAICLGKSTYARCGIVCNVTPLEPEWRGKVTIEISNTTPLPAKVYADEGIGQVIFLKGLRECFTSYADKGGRYQDQKGITLPFVSKEPDDGRIFMPPGSLCRD